MREQILAAIEPRSEVVTLGGLTLHVREMPSAADTTAFLEDVDMGYKLVVRSVFDEKGDPVFTDEDIPKLKRGAKARLAPLFAAVNRVNGMVLEDAAKNSGAGPGAG